MSLFKLLSLSWKVTGISEDQLLISVLPGLPTTAEIFIVPSRGHRGGAAGEKRKHLEQVRCSLRRMSDDTVGTICKRKKEVAVNFPFPT